MPYANEYSVSPIELLGVVRYDQRTMGSSSGHLPFYLSSLFFRWSSYSMPLPAHWSAGGWPASISNFLSCIAHRRLGTSSGIVGYYPRWRRRAHHTSWWCFTTRTSTPSAQWFLLVPRQWFPVTHLRCALYSSHVSSGFSHAREKPHYSCDCPQHITNLPLTIIGHT